MWMLGLYTVEKVSIIIQYSQVQVGKLLMTSRFRRFYYIIHSVDKKCRKLKLQF